MPNRSYCSLFRDDSLFEAEQFDTSGKALEIRNDFSSRKPEHLGKIMYSDVTAAAETERTR